jgi:hypothetical protein
MVLLKISIAGLKIKIFLVSPDSQFHHIFLTPPSHCQKLASFNMRVRSWEVFCEGGKIRLFIFPAVERLFNMAAAGVANDATFEFFSSQTTSVIQLP